MAWTAPMTAVSGAVYTAAQFNTFVRDNLNETMPARATAAGNYFVTSGTNRISERTPAQGYISTQNGFDSTSYGDPDLAGLGGEAIVPGPAVTVFTGSMALVCVGGRIGGGSTSTQSVKMSWEVSGESSIQAQDAWAAGVVGAGGSSGWVYDSRAYLCTGLTDGLNTFTAKYAVSSTPGYASFRTLVVLPF